MRVAGFCSSLVCSFLRGIKCNCVVLWENMQRGVSSEAGGVRGGRVMKFDRCESWRKKLKLEEENMFLQGREKKRRHKSDKDSLLLM